MRIAIVGAGSLGIVIGARLAPRFPDLVMIDADPANVEALNRYGARVTGSMTLSEPVSAIVPSQMAGIYDLVLLLTKQTHNKEALAQLRPHLGKASVVVTLQNGIPEEGVAAIVGATRTMGGTVGFGATYVAPGISQLTSTVEAVERHAFEIGEMSGSVTSRLRPIANILSIVGHCEIVADLMAIRWSKLLMNATFSGVSTALACSFGDVLDDPEAMIYLALLADEVVRVAHADGYQLARMQGEDMNSLRLKNGETVAEKMPLYRRVWSHHSSLRASMLQDIQRGRATEVHAINGHVTETGRRMNMATPFNQLITDIIVSAELQKKLPERSDSAKRMNALALAALNWRQHRKTSNL